MPKSPTRPRRRLSTATTRGKQATSPDVTSNEIIYNVLKLFDRLTLEIAQLRKRAAGSTRSGPGSHGLYPYAPAIGELLTLWHQAPEYLDDAGNPAPIRLKGARPSLSDLARDVRLEMDATVLVAELQKLGAVSTDDHGFIHIQTRSFPAYADKHLAIQHTLAALEGFIRTLRENLINPPGSDSLFHRIAWTEDFDARELPALKVWITRHGQAFLERLDDWLAQRSAHKTVRRNRGVCGSKVSVGVYLSVHNK